MVEGVAVPAAARAANNQLTNNPVIDAADGPKRKQQAWSDPLSSMLHKRRRPALGTEGADAPAAGGSEVIEWVFQQHLEAAIKARQLCSGSS